ncbi:hypothetical protein VTK26DRAFT_9505 [Humicola hyalothermophila]
MVSIAIIPNLYKSFDRTRASSLRRPRGSPSQMSLGSTQFHARDARALMSTFVWTSQPAMQSISKPQVPLFRLVVPHQFTPALLPALALLLRPRRNKHRRRRHVLLPVSRIDDGRIHVQLVMPLAPLLRRQLVLLLDARAHEVKAVGARLPEIVRLQLGR